MKSLLMGIGTSTTNTPTAPISWYTQLEQTTLGSKWQLKLHIRGETAQTREAITMGTALAVSGVSFRNQCGTCAWIIKGANEMNQIDGSMLTLGNKGDHSMFRSKVAGLYGLLMTIWYLLKEN